MLKTFDVSLDIENQTSNNIFTISQNDLQVVEVTFSLSQDKSLVDLTGLTLRVAIKKPSGLTVVQDCTVVDPMKGKFKVVLSTQAYSEVGVYTGEIYVYGTDQVAVTGSFSYSSKVGILNDTTLESSNDWQAINDALLNYMTNQEARDLIDAAISESGVNLQNYYNKGEIDTQLTSVTSQLAEKVTKGQIVSSDLKTLSESDRLGLSNLKQEVIQAMAGTTPVNSIPADKSVTPEKTSFIDNISINLFDKTTITDNFYINPVNGALVADVNFVATDYIPVTPSQQYATNMSYGAPLAFYNASKTFISGAQVNPATAPTNAAYVRWSMDKTNKTLDTFMIVKGSVAPNEYMPYGVYKISSTVQIPSVEVTDVTFIKNESINLFDKTKVTNDGFYINANGSLGATVGFCVSDFIPVTPNEAYITNMTYAPPFAVYDENKNIITGVSQTNPVTMPSNGAFVRWSVDKTNKTLDTFMIVKGTIVPSVYVPYSLKAVLKDVYMRKEQVLDLNSNWSGAKVDVLGDSITAMNLWQPTVASKLGTQTFSNHGVSGSCISGASVDAMWTDSRINALSNDSDLYLVMGGTNDWSNNTLLESGNKLDTTTFKGAYRVLLEKLITKFPNKHVAIMTTPYGKVPNRAGWTDQTGIVNNNGFSTRDYAKACREVAGEYGIPVIDIDANTFFNKINLTQFVTDETNMIVHPNANGAKRIAEIVIGKLKQIEPI
jgi:lysophospholipase L1-like esterase